MNPADFEKTPSGRLVPTLDGTMAFVPNPLPPPIIDLGYLAMPIARATQALGELSGLGRALPNPYLLIQPFMRKEAIASSKIEGTVTSIPELIELEASPDLTTARAETIEVRNYARALQDGIARIATLPVSTRLMSELHRTLMTGVAAGRGAHIVPGEFKRDQNWIGGRLIHNARFVPPPPTHCPDCMSDLEKYIHADDDEVPLVVRLALIHYQFETIHPVPDGNGRIGRLLIPLILAERGAMSHPMLYLSDFFDKNYDEYIDLMYEVSRCGLWTSWIAFFLRAIEESSRDAIGKATLIQELYQSYRSKIQSARTSALLGTIVDEIFTVPALTTQHTARRLNISYNAAKANIERLIDLGILFRGPAETRPAWFYGYEILGIMHREEEARSRD